MHWEKCFCDTSSGHRQVEVREGIDSKIVLPSFLRRTILIKFKIIEDAERSIHTAQFRQQQIAGIPRMDRHSWQLMMGVWQRCLADDDAALLD
jgi:hypothetical protein